MYVEVPLVVRYCELIFPKPCSSNVEQSRMFHGLYTSICPCCRTTPIGSQNLLCSVGGSEEHTSSLKLGMGGISLR